MWIFPTSSTGLSVKDIVPYKTKDVLREALRLCISPAPGLANLVIPLYCTTFFKKALQDRILICVLPVIVLPSESESLFFPCPKTI